MAKHPRKGRGRKKFEDGGTISDSTTAIIDELRQAIEKNSLRGACVRLATMYRCSRQNIHSILIRFFPDYKKYMKVPKPVVQQVRTCRVCHLVKPVSAYTGVSRRCDKCAKDHKTRCARCGDVFVSDRVGAYCTECKEYKIAVHYKLIYDAVTGKKPVHKEDLVRYQTMFERYKNNIRMLLKKHFKIAVE